MPRAVSRSSSRSAFPRRAWQEALAFRHLFAPLPARFILLAQEHSGSTKLARLIASQETIRCDGDLLGKRRLAPLAFVENRARGARSAWYGFRASPAHLAERQGCTDVAGLLGRLHARGWKILHLSRENLLDQAIASLLGRTSAQGVLALAGCTGGVRRALDPARVIARTEEIAVSLDAERTALQGLEHLSLCYERDLLDGAARAAALARVHDFLGAPRDHVVADLRSVVQRPLAVTVANFEEIAAAVAMTPFAIYLPALAQPLAVTAAGRGGER